MVGLLLVLSAQMLQVLKGQLKQRNYYAHYKIVKGKLYLAIVFST
jgi:hypothetical protein